MADVTKLVFGFAPKIALPKLRCGNVCCHNEESTCAAKDVVILVV
jgi:hypothetical protein